MGVDAGSVSAEVRAKYISDLKQGLADDEKALKKFQSEYASAMNVPQVAEMMSQQQAKIALTRSELEKLGEGAGGAGRSLRKMGDDADEGSRGLVSMEGIIERMLIRVGILMAIRGVFNFTEGIFQNAADLERLNAQFGITTDKLQQLQYAGSQTDIPFQKITAAVQTLQKNLAEFKGGDALREMGLSFEKLATMTKDQQIDAVFNSIAASSDRVRLASILLGTDGIAPLILKWNDLKGAAEGAGAVIDQDHLRRLADADEQFKKLGENTKIAGAEMVVFGMDMKDTFKTIEGQTIYLVAGAAGLAAYTKAIDILNPKQKELAASIVATPPLMGQAYIDSLKQAVVLSDDMIKKLDQLNQLNALTQESAARGAGATAIEYQAYLKQKAEILKLEREHDTILMSQFRSQEQLLTLIEREGVETRKLSQEKAALLRIQSDLSDEEIKLYATIAPVSDSRSRISDLQAQDRAEKALAESVAAELHSEVDRQRVMEAYAKVHEQIATKIVAEEEKINKVLITQAELARQARAARMGSQGMQLDSSPIDANISPFDAAARHYAETIANIDRMEAAMLVSEEDATKLRLKAMSDEIAAFDAANKAIYGLKVVTDLAGQSLNKMAAQANTVFLSPSTGSSFSTPYYNPEIHNASHYASGGPTREGPAYLHNREFVVPEGGALVMRGGGGNVTVNLTLHGVMASDQMALESGINKIVVDSVKSVMKLGSQ